MEQRNVFPQFPSISFQKFLMKSEFHGLQFLARAVKWKAWPSTACRDWMCCVRLVQIGGRYSFPLERYVYLHEWALFMANQVNIYHTWIVWVCILHWLWLGKIDTSTAPVMPLSPCGYGNILGCEHQTPDSPTSHTNVVGTFLDLSSCGILCFFQVPNFLFFVLSICESARKKKNVTHLSTQSAKNIRNPVQARRRISFFVKISKS